jgi:hypothetical protein
VAQQRQLSLDARCAPEGILSERESNGRDGEQVLWNQHGPSFGEPQECYAR